MLVLVDMWTRYCEATPLKNATRKVSDAILSFLDRAGQVETVSWFAIRRKLWLQV